MRIYEYSFFPAGTLLPVGKLEMVQMRLWAGAGDAIEM
jgi:hypothetical protein